MEMRLQPNNWSCLPTAFAMAMNTTPEILIKQLGHDGSEIWWEHNPEPHNRRGFHIQEIINIAWILNFHITEFQPRPISGSLYSFKQYPVPLRAGLFDAAVKSCQGVLTGEFDGKPHAVAWNKEKVYDPNGTVYSIENFSIREFYAVTKQCCS